MSTTDATVEGARPTPSGESGLFARNATGLVRGVSPRSALVLNFIPGHPAIAVTSSFFIVFSLFPGGNYLLGLLLVLPLTLAFAYAFGLLTQMIPRSSGDYMLVSRVIHPALGMISSLFFLLSNALAAAFFGIAFVTVGLAPALIGLGLIAGDHSLINAGTTISTSHGWEFGIGAVMMLVPAIMLAGGWRWTLRFQNTLFWMATGSIVICALVALFLSPGAFRGDFNSFASPLTHNPDSYHAIINTAVKAGVNLHPGFSFSQTIAVMGFFAAFGVYSFWSTFVGGELRQASTMKTANTMAIAGVVSLLATLVIAVIFLHTFGKDFMTAAQSPTGLGSAIPTGGFWFFLTGVAVGSPVFFAIIALAFVVFWPLITYVVMIQPTRMMFAYAFDGLLPKAVTKTSSRGAPVVAVVITYLIMVATLLWAVNSSSFVQVLVYAVLAQLVSMGLVGLAGVLAPTRRRALYQASSSNKSFFGVPLVSIAGAVAVFGAVLLWFLYFHFKVQFGLSNTGRMFAIFGATVVIGIVYYLVAKAVRKSQGVDLDLVYKEIPPE